MKNQLTSVRRLERILDNAIRLPGGYTIGLDGIIGLIPGVGDLFTSGISSFIIFKAIKMRVPKVIIARMLVNTAIDTVFGAIPIVGDFFDFFFKSNVKNSKLLHQYAEKPRHVEKQSYAAIGTFVIVALLFFAVAVWLSISLFQALIKAVL